MQNKVLFCTFVFVNNKTIKVMKSWTIYYDDRQFLLRPASITGYDVIECFDKDNKTITLNKTFYPEYYVKDNDPSGEDKMKMWFTRWLEVYEGKYKDYTVCIGKSEYKLEGFYNNDEELWEFLVFEITRYDTHEIMYTKAIGNTTFVPRNVPIGNMTDDVSDTEMSELRTELTEWLFEDFVIDTKSKQNETRCVWVLTVLTLDNTYTTLSRKEEYFGTENDAVVAWTGSKNSIVDVLGKDNLSLVSNCITESVYYSRYAYKANANIEFVFELKKHEIK